MQSIAARSAEGECTFFPLATVAREAKTGDSSFLGGDCIDPHVSLDSGGSPGTGDGGIYPSPCELV